MVMCESQELEYQQKVEIPNYVEYVVIEVLFVDGAVAREPKYEFYFCEIVK